MGLVTNMEYPTHHKIGVCLNRHACKHVNLYFRQKKEPSCEGSVKETQ